MDTRETVRRFIRSLLARRDDDRPFADDESLLLSGRLDSVDVVEIVTFVETHLRRPVDADGFDQAQFDSVDAIVAWASGATP